MTRYTRIPIDRNGTEVVVTVCVEDGSVTYAEDDDGKMYGLSADESSWAIMQSEEEESDSIAVAFDRKYDECKDRQNERFFDE